MILKKVILFFFILNFFLLEGQTANDSVPTHKLPPWTFKFGIDAMGYSGIEAQLNFFVQGKYTIGFGAWNVNRKSKNTPTDYHLTNNFTKRTKRSIRERLVSFGLLTGYIIHIPQTKDRFHLQAGIYYNKLKYPDNFKKETHYNLLFETNYSYSWVEKHYISLVLSPSFDFPMSKAFGISLQPKILLSLKEINMMMNVSIFF